MEFSKFRISMLFPPQHPGSFFQMKQTKENAKYAKGSRIFNSKEQKLRIIRLIFGLILSIENKGFGGKC